MDNRYFIPRLERAQYQLFRELPGTDFPDTYDEWLKFPAKQRQDRGRMGFEVIEVPIDPHNFASYCRTRGIPATMEWLHKFADELGYRNV
jgi:hypothetical protein